MPLRITQFILIGLMAFGLLVLSERPSLADQDPPEWLTEVRLGYAYLKKEPGEQHGMNIGWMGGYRLFDRLYLKLDTDFSMLQLDLKKQGYLLDATAGVNYDIDLLPLMVTIGSGIGPLLRNVDNEGWRFQGVWHVLFALQFAATDRIGAGLEARYHLILPDSWSDPLYITLAAKVSFAFE